MKRICAFTVCSVLLIGCGESPQPIRNTPPGPKTDVKAAVTKLSPEPTQQAEPKKPVQQTANKPVAETPPPKPAPTESEPKKDATKKPSGGGLFSAIFRAREAARKAQRKNHLKMLGISTFVYSDKNRDSRMADNIISGKDADAKKLLSWRLNPIDVGTIDGPKGIDTTKAWDDPANKKFAKTADEVWGLDAEKTGKTRYLMVVPLGREKDPNPFYRLTELERSTQAMSETLLIVEVAPEKAVPWTKPEDFIVDEKDPFKNLGYKKGETFLALMCDGSVREFTTDMDPKKFKAMCESPQPVNKNIFE